MSSRAPLGEVDANQLNRLTTSQNTNEKPILGYSKYSTTKPVQLKNDATSGRVKQEPQSPAQLTNHSSKDNRKSQQTTADVRPIVKLNRHTCESSPLLEPERVPNNGRVASAPKPTTEIHELREKRKDQTSTEGNNLSDTHAYPDCALIERDEANVPSCLQQDNCNNSCKSASSKNAATVNNRLCDVIRDEPEQTIQDANLKATYAQLAGRLKARLELAQYKIATKQTHIEFSELVAWRLPKAALSSQVLLAESSQPDDGGSEGQNTPKRRRVGPASAPAASSQRRTPTSMKAAKSLLQLGTF